MGQRRVIHGNRRIQFGIPDAQPGAWSPLLLPLLQCFWRADVGVSAAPVQTWQNSSGVVDATRNLVQPAAGLRPAAYVTSDPDFGGRPSIQPTAGSAQRMVTGAFTTPTTNAATFFAVVRASAPTDYMMIGQMNPQLSGSGNHTFARFYPMGGGNYGVQAQSGPTDVFSWAVDVKNKTLGVILVYTSTTLKLYVNSLTMRGSAAITTAYIQPTQVSTFALEAGGIWGGVHVAELGMIADEMTPADIGLLFNYWNVTRGYGLATIP